MRQLHRIINAAGPGWFTSVMGTGILGISIAASPVRIPHALLIAGAIWGLATLVFTGAVALVVLRVLTAPSGLIATMFNPSTAMLWGAPPMASFTVAVGLVRIAAPHGGGEVAIATAQVLWVAGVVLSLFSAFFVPLLMMTNHKLEAHNALAAWLLPVVPPIVGSVPAALLLPSFPAAFQPTVLVVAYAMLGLGVGLSVLTLGVYYSRLLFAKVPRGALAPTMWLVVGPLGQSIAGAYALGTIARTVWPAFGQGLQFVGIGYGLVVWGFAIYWLVLALVTTLQAVRTGMPFTLGWWSFTFPVGVLISGTDALYTATGAVLFEIAAMLLLALLATSWTIVATRTVHGAVRELVNEPVAATQLNAAA